MLFRYHLENIANFIIKWQDTRILSSRLMASDTERKYSQLT